MTGLPFAGCSMTDHDPGCILSYLRERRQDMVDLLQRLALAESPSRDAAAAGQVLALLAAELEKPEWSAMPLFERENGAA